MYDLEKIEFKGPKRFLSNMYVSPIIFKDKELEEKFPEIEFDGKEYRSVEHLYQTMKSKNKEYQEFIRGLDRTNDTKKFARKLITEKKQVNGIGPFELRKDWQEVNLKIMEIAVTLKFKQNPDLKEKLKKTEGHIEERNCWGDTFWGTVDGKGENHLGKILMKVRERL